MAENADVLWCLLGLMRVQAVKCWPLLSGDCPVLTNSGDLPGSRSRLSVAFGGWLGAVVIGLEELWRPHHKLTFL